MAGGVTSDGWEWPQPPPLNPGPQPPRPPGPPPRPPGPPPGLPPDLPWEPRRQPAPRPSPEGWGGAEHVLARRREARLAARENRPPAPAAPEPPRAPRTTLWLTLGIAGLSFVLRAYTALASFETADERGWMTRSSRFWGALSSFDFRGTSAASQGEGDSLPGVTTMWIGSIARGFWATGAGFGLWDSSDPASRGGATGFTYTRSGLNVAQVTMALATSVLLALVVVLLVAWVGKVAAGVAGVLIATEPFLVAHGAILHTDELLALFGLAALVCAALALGLPNVTDWAGRGRTGAAGGALLMLAVLTKATAIFLLVPPLGLLVAWAGARTFTGRGVDAGWRPLFRVLIFAGLAAGVVFVVANPALWGDPLGQVRELAKAALGGDAGGQRQFFLGESTLTPGPTFYLVTLPLRITPWLLVAVVVSMVAVWLHQATRGYGVAIAVMAGLPLAWLSISARQFDRYGLVLVLFAAVLVGVVVAATIDGLTSVDLSQQLRWVAGGAVALVGLHALVMAPWGLAYFNPALGGAGKAEDTMRIGWGEGVEQAGGLVADVVEMGGGSCDDVTVSGYWSLVSQERCGRLPVAGTGPDYVVVYVSARQGQPGLTARSTEGREVVAEKDIRGITYLQVYGPRADADVKPLPDAPTDPPADTESPAP